MNWLVFLSGYAGSSLGIPFAVFLMRGIGSGIRTFQYWLDDRKYKNQPGISDSDLN